MFELQSALTSSNFDVLVGHIASEITTQLEKAVMKTTFNRVSISVRSEPMQMFIFARFYVFRNPGDFWT